jgi:hypothetical protein
MAQNIARCFTSETPMLDRTLAEGNIEQSSPGVEPFFTAWFEHVVVLSAFSAAL